MLLLTPSKTPSLLTLVFAMPCSHVNVLSKPVTCLFIVHPTGRSAHWHFMPSNKQSLSAVAQAQKNSLVLYSCRKLCSGVTVVCRRRTNTFAWEWSGSLPTGRVTFLKHIHCRCHLYLAVCMYSKKTHAAALYFCINDKHIHKSQ